MIVVRNIFVKNSQIVFSLQEEYHIMVT